MDVCEPARKTVSVPLLNSGNHTPETALNLIKSGNADLVMFGRPMIAEPEIAKKIMNGKRDEVRPCIRCNDDCIGRIITRRTKISCSVNLVVGFESRFAIQKTAAPKKVVVIGGGPSGMEAARTAALMGHKEVFISANTVVSSFGMKPNDGFAREVDAKYHAKTRLIGDTVKVGKVGGAVREGMYAAMSIE